MKQHLSFCLLSTLCLAVTHSVAVEAPCLAPSQSIDYGVGFSLSLEYGTCSIWYANGSAVDVAKIEGNGHYKNAMHHLRAADQDPKSGTPVSQPPPILASLVDVLPSPIANYLGGALDRWYKPISSDTAIISDMLRTLKAAAESYLGFPVSTADTVTPMPMSPNGYQILESAYTSLRLRKATNFPVAGSVAAMANRIGPYYQDPESCFDGLSFPKLVLTVDYSRAALTALLYYEEDCTFEKFRVLHDTALGTDSLDKCQGQAMSSSLNETLVRCSESLEEALKKIVELPVNQGAHDYPLPAKIGGLALLGERGTDPRLRKVLHQVLAGQQGAFSSSEEHTPSDIWVSDTMVDPTFAAARGIAAASWGNQDWNSHP